MALEIPSDPEWCQLIPRSHIPENITHYPLGRELVLPVREGVFIHHTVTEWDDNWHIAYDRVVQTGMQRFGTLSYKYLYHRYHKIFIQGQGPRRSPDTTGYNSTSISIAVIGNTHTEYAPVAPISIDDEDMLRIARFVDWLRDRHIVTKDCKVRPHQSVKATACPGSGVMRKWNVLEQALEQRLPWRKPAPVGESPVNDPSPQQPGPEQPGQVEALADALRVVEARTEAIDAIQQEVLRVQSDTRARVDQNRDRIEGLERRVDHHRLTDG